MKNINLTKSKTYTHIWNTKPSCLDSAYERLAVEQGLNNKPVFKENNKEHYFGYKEN